MSRRELERLFFQKCQRGMMFSPKEWLLVERWETAGIPYEVMAKGIELTFQKLAEPSRKVSLYECEPQVQLLWQRHEKNRLSKKPLLFKVTADEGEKEFALEKLAKISAFLNKPGKAAQAYPEIYGRMQASLAKIEWEIKNAPLVNTLKLADAVAAVFEQGWAELKERLSEELKTRAQRELEKELQPVRQNMTPQAFKDTITTVLDEKLREIVGFEKFNLFSSTL